MLNFKLYSKVSIPMWSYIKYGKPLALTLPKMIQRDPEKSTHKKPKYPSK